MAQPPDPVDAGALLDDLDTRSREPHQITPLEPDAERSEVACRVERDLAWDLTMEFGVEDGVVGTMDRHEVLGRVMAVLGDEFRIVSSCGIHVTRILDAQHRETRRLPHHDVGPRPDLTGERHDVLLRDTAESLDIASLEERRPTTAHPGHLTLDAVALEDLHQVLTDRRSSVLDEAGRHHRDAALAAPHRDAWPMIEPGR